MALMTTPISTRTSTLMSTQTRTSTRARSPRGYSLIELALTMVISGIITTAALSTFSVVNRQVVQSRMEAGVDTKLQRTLAGIAGDLQEAGGGSLRPWHSLFVYPGSAATGGSDAILTFSADGNYEPLPCPVVSYIGTVLTVGEVPDPAAPPSTKCCLAFATGDFTLNGRFAAINHSGDSVIVGFDAATRNVAACTITARALLAPERLDPAHNWATGTMTVVDAKWIAVDHTTHELSASMLQYLAAAPPGRPGLLPPGMPITIEGRKRVLARDVYDLQVALGYDTTGSAVVAEERDGVDDGWLGNATGETAGETWIGDERTEAGFKGVQFRMIDIGLVVGLRTKSGKTRAGVGVLDGPTYPSTATPRCMADHSMLYMRGGRARVLLRNSGVYE